MAVVAALATPRTAERLARLAEARVAVGLRPALRRPLAAAMDRLRRENLIRPAACCAETDAFPLAGAESVCVGVATVGQAISAASRRCFDAGDALGGVLLDQLGTAAVGVLAERLEVLVRAAARAQGRRAGSALHPGDRLMPLSVQERVLDLAGAAEIGAGLGSTRAMHPLKTVSLAIPIGPNAARWLRRAECAQCPSRLKCQRGRRC